VRVAEPLYAIGCRHETQEADAKTARTLERADGRYRASAGREHRIEHKEVSLGRVAWDFKIVVDWLQGVVVPIETNVSDASRWDESKNALNHAQTGAENRDERELLPTDLVPGGLFERGLDRHRVEGQLRCCFIGHQHRDLVDEFLEDLRRCSPVAQQRDLVLNKRVAHKRQVRERGGGGHGREATIFAPMKEYQAVIHRLTRRTREDEDALTDLLNERMRGGWEPAMMSQDEERLTLIFQRETDTDRH